MLERGAVCSDQNLCVHISACGSPTQYSSRTKLGLSVGVEAGAHPAPQAPRGRGSVGTPSKCPPRPERSHFWLWYSCGVEWLQQRQQMKLAEERLGPTLTCQCMGYSWSVHLGCKGQRDKPSKLALITCFTVSKTL